MFPRVAIVALAVSGSAFAWPSFNARASCNVPATLNSYKAKVADLLGQMGQLYYGGQASVSQLRAGFNQILKYTVQAEQEINNNCRDAQRVRRDVDGEVEDLSAKISDLLGEVQDILGHESEKLDGKISDAVQSLQGTAGDVAGAATSKRQTTDCDVPGTLTDFKTDISTVLGELANEYYSGTATVESLTTGFNEIVANTVTAEQDISDSCSPNSGATTTTTTTTTRRDVVEDVNDLADNVKSLLGKVESILGEKAAKIQSKVEKSFSTLTDTATSVAA